MEHRKIRNFGIRSDSTWVLLGLTLTACGGGGGGGGSRVDVTRPSIPANQTTATDPVNFSISNIADDPQDVTVMVLKASGASTPTTPAALSGGDEIDHPVGRAENSEEITGRYGRFTITRDENGDMSVSYRATLNTQMRTELGTGESLYDAVYIYSLFAGIQPAIVQPYIVEIEGENDDPSVIVGTHTGRVTENDAGAAISLIRLTPDDDDQNNNGIFQFRIESAESGLSDSQANRIFEVVSVPGSSTEYMLKLKSGQSLDYETKSSYSLKVIVIDRHGGELEAAQTITVNVNDDPDETTLPPSTNDSATFSITSDGVLAAPAVGDLLTATKTADDPDGNGTFLYIWYHIDGNRIIQGLGGGDTYRIKTTDQGETIGVRVTYIDGRVVPESVTAEMENAVAIPPTGRVSFSEITAPGPNMGSFHGSHIETDRPLYLDTVRQTWDMVINHDDNAVLKGQLDKLGLTFKSAKLVENEEDMARIIFSVENPDALNRDLFIHNEANPDEIVFTYSISVDSSDIINLRRDENDVRIIINDIDYEKRGSRGDITFNMTFDSNDTRILSYLTDLDPQYYIIEVTDDPADNRPVSLFYINPFIYSGYKGLNGNSGLLIENANGSGTGSSEFPPEPIGSFEHTVSNVAGEWRLKTTGDQKDNDDFEISGVTLYYIGTDSGNYEAGDSLTIALEFIADGQTEVTHEEDYVIHLWDDFSDGDNLDYKIVSVRDSLDPGSKVATVDEINEKIIIQGLVSESVAYDNAILDLHNPHRLSADNGNRYELSGPDAEFFIYSPYVLSVIIFDFENPVDDGADNTYRFTETEITSAGERSSIDYVITISDVDAASDPQDNFIDIM